MGANSQCEVDMQIVISLFFVFLIIGIILYLGKTACKKAAEEDSKKSEDEISGDS